MILIFFEIRWKRFCCFFLLLFFPFLVNGCPKRQTSTDPKPIYRKALKLCSAAAKRNSDRRQALFYSALISEKLNRWKDVARYYELYLAATQSSELSDYLTNYYQQAANFINSKGVLWTVSYIWRQQNKAVAKDLAFGEKKIGSIAWSSSYSKANVSKENLGNPNALRLYLLIARSYYKMNNYLKMQNFYLMAHALALEMRHYGVAPVGISIPKALSEARFFLTEKRRKHFLDLKFPSRPSQKIKSTLKNILNYGLSLTRDYAFVALEKVPKWTLAAYFRQSEIYYIMNRKTQNPFIFKSFSKKYRRSFQALRLNWLTKATTGYLSVLKRSSELKIFNRWTSLCEQAFRKLKKLPEAKNVKFPSWWKEFQLRKQEYVPPTPPPTFPYQLLEQCRSF